MFKLGDLEFDVKEAVFHGCFYDAAMSKRNYLKGVEELLWHIDIHMESGKFITKLSDEELAELDEGEVIFSGINAHCITISTLEELKPVMKDFINLDEFDCVAEESRKNGTSTDYTWKFKPNNID